MQVENIRYLASTLTDLLITFATVDNLGTEIFEKTFRSEDLDGEFRVPAADTGHELFFDNRELLNRFTSLTKRAQEELLKCIRAAMLKHSTTIIHLKIPWTSKGTRVIKIRQIGSTETKLFGEGPLNIYLE